VFNQWDFCNKKQAKLVRKSTTKPEFLGGVKNPGGIIGYYRVVNQSIFPYKDLPF
jgi:hypothetical protein